MENKENLLYSVRNTSVYKDGRYKYETDNIGIGGRVNEYYDIASAQFNQFKAKLFNLIEASVPDKTQQEALKGLVRGFANDHYKALVEDLSGLMDRLGLQDPDMAENVPWGLNPLGNGEFVPSPEDN